MVSVALLIANGICLCLIVLYAWALHRAHRRIERLLDENGDLCARLLLAEGVVDPAMWDWPTEGVPWRGSPTPGREHAEEVERHGW